MQHGTLLLDGSGDLRLNERVPNFGNARHAQLKYFGMLAGGAKSKGESTGEEAML